MNVPKGQRQLRDPLWWLVLGLVLVFHLTKNFTDIDHATFWQDEAKNYVAATQPYRELPRISILQDQPMLHYVVLHEVMRFGSSEAVLRGTSWAFIFGMLLFAALGMKDEPRWLRALFILVFVFYYFSRYLSQEMRPYAMGVMMSFISSVCFLRACDQPNRKTVTWYGITQFLSMNTFSLAVIGFLVQGVYLGLLFLPSLVSKSVEFAATLRRYRGIMIAMALISLSYLPYAIIVGQAQPVRDPVSRIEMIQQAFMVQHYLHALKWLVQQDEWFDIPGYSLMVKHGAIGLMALGVGVELRRKNYRILFWVLYLVITVAFIRMIIFKQHHFFTPRYMVPCYFASCFLIATGGYHLARGLGAALGRLPRFTPAKVQLAGKLALVVLIVLLLISPSKRFVHYLHSPLPQRPWRVLLSEMRALPGPKVVMSDQARMVSMYQHIARNDEDIIFAPQYYGPDDLSDAREILQAGVYERFPEARYFFYIQSHITEETVLREVFIPRMEAYGFVRMQGVRDKIDNYQVFAYQVVP